MEDIITANEKMNKWCGTEGINYYEGDTALGFLFKYAVAGLKSEQRWDIELKSIVGFPNVYLARAEAHLNPDCFPSGKTINKDPALALFWALWQIKKEEK